MTKTRWMMAAVAAAVLVAPLARAEDDDNKGGGEWGRKVMKELQLSADQKTKIEAINEEQMKTQKPLWESLRAQMKELRDLVKEKAADDKITAKLDQIKATNEQIATNRKTFQGQKEAVLTPMQRAKVVLAVGKWMKEKGEHRKGHDKEEDED